MPRELQVTDLVRIVGEWRDDMFIAEGIMSGGRMKMINLHPGKPTPAWMVK